MEIERRAPSKRRAGVDLMPACRPRASSPKDEPEVRWVGEPTCTIAGCHFYDQVQVDGQCYSVGESVQMKAPKTALPYIAKIQALWEDTKMRMSTIWYWHPDDTAIGRLPEHGVREVFIGTVADTNLVDTITGRTTVYAAKCELEAAAADTATCWYYEQCYDGLIGKCRPKQASFGSTNGPLCRAELQRLVSKQAKRIRVGSEYQATELPEYEPQTAAKRVRQSFGPEGTLIWQPPESVAAEAAVVSFEKWTGCILSSRRGPTVQMDSALQVLHQHREQQETGSFSRACTELMEQWRQSNEIEWTPQEICLLRQHVTLRGTSLESLKELVASLGTKTIPQLMDYYWKHTKLWRLDPDEKEWL